MILAKWLLILLFSAATVGIGGGWTYRQYQKNRLGVTPFPSSSAQITPYSLETPTSVQSAGKIKIIDGNVCLVGENERIKILVDKNDWQAASVESFADVSVSPDNRKLCFLGRTIQPTWLFWSKIDGSNATKVNALAKNCVWSQNSDKIAFNNETSDVSPVDVHVYDIQTGQLTNLTQSVNQNETVFRIYQQPEWSENDTKITSKYIVFPDQTKGTSSINLSTHEIEDY